MARPRVGDFVWFSPVHDASGWDYDALGGVWDRPRPELGLIVADCSLGELKQKWGCDASGTPNEVTVLCLYNGKDEVVSVDLSNVIEVVSEEMASKECLPMTVRVRTVVAKVVAGEVVAEEVVAVKELCSIESIRELAKEVLLELEMRTRVRGAWIRWERANVETSIKYRILHGWLW